MLVQMLVQTLETHAQMPAQTLALNPVLALLLLKAQMMVHAVVVVVVVVYKQMGIDGSLYLLDWEVLLSSDVNADQAKEVRA